MPWTKPALASLALASAALWLTTAAASAQSVGLPSLPRSPVSPSAVSPSKVDNAVQTAKQTAAPVVEMAKQTSKAASKTASQAVKTVATSVPAVVPTVPPLPAALSKPPAPLPDVEPVVHETVDPVRQETDAAVATVVDEFVAVAAAAVPDSAAIAESVVAPSEPLASQDEAPLAKPEPSQVATVAAKPAVITPDITTVSAAEDASIDEPSSVEDETDAVLPVADEIAAIHDREPIVIQQHANSGPSSNIEEWVPLTASETIATTGVESAPAVDAVALAASETIDRAEATTEQATPPAGPSEPQQRPEPQPVGPSSVGLSWNGAADWVSQLASISSRGSWTRLVTVGRTLPSVIVLPNLAPPG